jgi:hypothetical protein
MASARSARVASTPFVSPPQAQAFNPELARTGLNTARPAYGDVLADIESRRASAAVAASAPSRTLTEEAAAAAAQRAFVSFAATHAGWYIFNAFNEGFVNWYAVPAVRALEFIPARSDSAADMLVAHATAAARVRVLAAREDITSMPLLTEANTPFLIPYSEASLRAFEHTAHKRVRALERAARFTRLRNSEFEKRKAAADTAAPIAAPVLSEFNMWKQYRDTPRSFEFTPPEGQVPAASVLRRVLAEQRARLDAWAATFTAAAPAPAKIRDVPVASTQPRLPALDSDDDDVVVVDSDSSATPVLESSAADVTPLVSAAAPAPRPALLETVPAKWTTTTPGTIEHELPLELRPRSYMAVSFIIDLDTPEDSAEFPLAAGMEPTCIFWGGTYDTHEEASEVVTTSIAPIAIDFPVDVIKTGLVMYPSEMDEDAVEVKHRPENTSMQATLQTVMDARTTGMSQMRAAIDYNASGGNIGTVVIEDSAERLPSLDDMVVNPVRIESIVQGDVGSAPDTVEASVFREAAAGRSATFVTNARK